MVYVSSHWNFYIKTIEVTQVWVVTAPRECRCLQKLVLKWSHGCVRHWVTLFHYMSFSWSFYPKPLTISAFSIYEGPFRGSVFCSRTLWHADGEDWGLNHQPSGQRTTTLPSATAASAGSLVKKQTKHLYQRQDSSSSQCRCADEADDCDISSATVAGSVISD